MPVLFAPNENYFVLSDGIINEKRKQKNRMVMKGTEPNENVVVGYIPKVPFQLFIFLLCKILLF